MMLDSSIRRIAEQASSGILKANALISVLCTSQLFSKKQYFQVWYSLAYFNELARRHQECKSHLFDGPSIIEKLNEIAVRRDRH